MRKIRFLNIFAVILALALFFPGCDSGTGPDKPGTTNPTYNGTIFVKSIGSSYVFLSIFSEKTTDKMISPKPGEVYSYAVAVIVFDANDDPVNRSDPSRGTVNISDTGGLIFIAGAGSPAETCEGTLLGTALTMKKVPGTNHTNIEMDIYRLDVVASASNPFPITLSPQGDDTPPSSTSPTDPNAPITAKGGDYSPGVIPIKFVINPLPIWGEMPKGNNSNFSTSPDKNSPYSQRRMYFEGDPVDLSNTGMKVTVWYNDGTSKTYSNNDILNVFNVEPPEFRLPVKGNTTWPAGLSSLGKSAFSYAALLPKDTDTTAINAANKQETYSLYFKDGLGNSSIQKSSDTNDKWAEVLTFKGPYNGNIFPIMEITYTPGNTSLLEWLEDETRVFPKDPIYDINGKEVMVSVKWWGSDYSWNNIPKIESVQEYKGGVVSISTGNYSLDYEGRYRNFHSRTETTFKLTGSYYQIEPVPLPGSKGWNSSANAVFPGTFSVIIGSWSVPYTFNAYRTVKNIEKYGKAPEINNQIIFDDPRLYGKERDPETNLHWLNRLKDGSIKVSYAETGTTRTRTMQEAFNIQGLDFFKYNNTPFTSAKGSIALNYFDKLILGYEVPVFSNLVGIEIKSKPGKEPVLSKSLDDNHNTFLQNYVTVTAIYEAGKDGTRVSRLDTYGQMNPGNILANDVNISCEGTFDSNIDSLLTKATSNYLKNPPVYTTVKVGFTPKGGVRKTFDFQIGAIGY